MSTHSALRRFWCPALLISATACMSYVRKGTESVTPGRNVRLDFTTPVDVRFTCAATNAQGDSASSACLGSVTSVRGATRVEGNVERIEGDSVLLGVTDVRDVAGHSHGFSPALSAWLPLRTSAAIAVRHTNPVRTIALVGLLVLGAAAIAVATSGPFGSDGTPKPPVH